MTNKQLVWAMRKYSHRWLTTLSLVIIGLILACFGFCAQVWQIFALRILTGAGAIGGLLTVVMSGEITDQETRTQGQIISSFDTQRNNNA